jgi:hypothetical protein
MTAGREGYENPFMYEERGGGEIMDKEGSDEVVKNEG